MSRHIRFLQGLCLFVAGCAAVPFSAAISDPDFQACGQRLSRLRCANPPGTIVVMGTIIAIAIVLCVWLGRRKVQ